MKAYNLPLVWKISINDPPTKYVINKKRPKFDEKTGKLITKDTYYLTANVFYASLHWAIRAKVVNYAKNWLMLFLTNIPKLEKCRLEVIYSSNKDDFDLDNKVYFWTKILLDLLKTPTDNQIAKAHKKGYKKIKTVNVLQEDTVRFVDEINMRYTKERHALTIKIYGRITNEQAKLF